MPTNDIIQCLGCNEDLFRKGPLTPDSEQIVLWFAAEGMETKFIGENPGGVNIHCPFCSHPHLVTEDGQVEENEKAQIISPHQSRASPGD